MERNRHTPPPITLSDIRAALEELADELTGHERDKVLLILGLLALYHEHLTQTLRRNARIIDD